MKTILQGLIKLYALILSPWIGNQCRFTPTCSAYAYDAIEEHGSIKGSWLAVKRLLKCHPFNKSNPIDPVPTNGYKRVTSQTKSGKGDHAKPE